MSKNYGYIKLYRDIQGHYLWNEKPFDRARAFVDLVMLANHSDKKVLINGNLKEIKRGQIFTSRKKLADRWGWDVKKVDRFLRLLKGDETLTTDGTADGTQTIMIIMIRRIKRIIYIHVINTASIKMCFCQMLILKKYKLNFQPIMRNESNS